MAIRLFELRLSHSLVTKDIHNFLVFISVGVAPIILSRNSINNDHNLFQQGNCGRLPYFKFRFRNCYIHFYQTNTNNNAGSFWFNKNMPSESNSLLYVNNVLINLECIAIFLNFWNFPYPKVHCRQDISTPYLPILGNCFPITLSIYLLQNPNNIISHLLFSLPGGVFPLAFL